MTTRTRRRRPLVSLFFKKRRGLTVELTRRRESKHPSPHESSCETRSRRSRPTICWATVVTKGAHREEALRLFQPLRAQRCLEVPSARVERAAKIEGPPISLNVSQDIQPGR